MKLLETFIGKRFKEAYDIKIKLEKIKEIQDLLDSITQLSSQQIESFINWFSFTSRYFYFLDDNEGVIVNRHRIMNKIDVIHAPEGCELLFTVTDDANKNRKISYRFILLDTHIKVYRYDTCTNFEKEYTAKVSEHDILTRKATPELFNTLKDFISFAIKMRSLYCIECKEDMYEAIPLSIFE